MTAGSFDPRLTTYFGDATLQAGFLPLPNLFLRHYAELGLSGQQAMFVVQLMATTWDLGSPPATLSDIAGRMGVTRRTAQAISAELHAKGILDIYDQYDDAGSQIENGYDLGPLFQRLATFAPAPLQSGTQRQRRARVEAPSEDATSMPAAAIVSPVAESSAPPWQASASPPGRKQHPSPDHEIQAPQQESARLKAESKTPLKNQVRIEEQQQTPAAVAARQIGWIGREEQANGGRSLRLDEPFSVAEVRRSRQILARIGLNADVADATATTLHPAECWALWLHACSSGLGPAWIAAQIYDRRRREPRMAGIPAACMAAGRLLDGLPPATATTLIDILGSGAPAAMNAVQAALGAGTPSSVVDDIQAALEAVWSAPATHRQAQVFGHPAQPSATGVQGAASHGAPDPRWQASQAFLQAALPDREYTTWIAPLVLLHAEERLAVIGTPNCFVRTEIQNTYAAALQEALEQAWGRMVVVELVIDTPVSA